MFAEDIGAFFNGAEFAVTAEFTPSDGGPTVSASVIFNAQTEQIFGDDVLTTEYTITFPAGSLPGVRSGDNGTVDGVRYRVREVRLKGDGALKVARLSKI